jgi:hypothetical protein
MKFAFCKHIESISTTVDELSFGDLWPDPAVNQRNSE